VNAPNPQLTSDQPSSPASPAPARKKVVSIVDRQEPERIRVELNIEKWPAIWQPAKAHTRNVLRSFEREVKLQDGSKQKAKLLVGFTELGTVTTEEQKMFYALIKRWEDSGKPAGKPVYFSDRLLAKLLRKKGWGTNVIEAMTGSLRKLRLTPLRWVRAFHRNDGSGKEYESEVPFQILNDLKIITRREGGHVTNQQGYFQFDKNIEANLLANFTKPLLTDEFFKIQSDIAQLIYTHIDLVMFKKTRYERCTKELFSDLGLTGSSYRFKSNRKQKLIPALKELEGKDLNHGVLKSAALIETEDGSDYKIIFLKTPRRILDQADCPPPPAAENPIPDPLVGQAEALLQHFYKEFHGVDYHYPQSKETSQALALISQHGFEKAMHIVDFARSAATNSNYTPQTFGGILQYASRAMAAWDARRNHEQNSQYMIQRQTEQLREESEARAQGEARLAALTPDQYQARFEQAKAELFRQHPFMATQHDASKLHEGAIRARIIRAMENEPPDLPVSGSPPQSAS
jgi:hypothetical protein